MQDKKQRSFIRTEKIEKTFFSFFLQVRRVLGNEKHPFDLLKILASTSQCISIWNKMYLSGTGSCNKMFYSRFCLSLHATATDTVI